MESDGTRVSPLSSAQWREVLRAGVRLIGEQFAPYDPDEPDESLADDPVLNLPVFSWNIAPMSKAIQQLQAEAIEKMLEKQKIFTVHARRIGRSSFGTHLHGAIFDELTEHKPAPVTKPVFLHGDTNADDRKLRNDGRIKNKKQTEPGYVALTKKKRR